jgi:hypothetical protein
MGQSSSWYFEQLFHGRTSPDTKLVLIEKLFYSSIPSLEFLILSDGDRHNSSIARIGTPWWVGIRMVNYYTWHHGALYVSKPKSNVVQSKKRNKGKIY